jgi:hypothetical protein
VRQRKQEAGSRKQEMWERKDRDLKKEKRWKSGKGVFGERKVKRASERAYALSGLYSIDR